jgi:hypothetical protein
VSVAAGAWPAWVEIWQDIHECKTRVIVHHKTLEYRFVVDTHAYPYKELRDHIYAIKGSLVRQQGIIDAVTKKLTSNSERP